MLISELVRNFVHSMSNYTDSKFTGFGFGVVNISTRFEMLEIEDFLGKLSLKWTLTVQKFRSNPTYYVLNVLQEINSF